MRVTAIGRDPQTVTTAAPRRIIRATENRRTVLVALTANLFIAAAKLVGALVSGSKALLAEAGHSLADCLNEAFLLIALWRSRRPATSRHPFGFGKEQFFWALLAAVAIFVTGAVVAVTEGVRALVAGEHRLSDVPLAFAILAIAALADGASMFRVVAQLRAEARRAGSTLLGHIRRTTDPTARTVLLEDGAGLLGVALAAVGLGLHQLTGDPRWDAAASIAVGAVLVGIAFEIGRDSKSLLLGEGAYPAEVAALRAVFASHEDVVDLVDMLTMRLGPDDLLVAAHIDLADDLSGAEVELLADSIERELTAAVPTVSQVFLDPGRGQHAVGLRASGG
jgi:cation diffusion facilitator family transporter